MICNRAFEIIKVAEGLRLTAYKCPAGVWRWRVDDRLRAHGPGYEVASYGGSRQAFEVFDRRDTSWHRRPIASCVTEEAAQAVVRLMERAP